MNRLKQPDDFRLTAVEAAKRLGVTKDWVLRECQAERIPARKVPMTERSGHAEKWLISASAVEARRRRRLARASAIAESLMSEEDGAETVAQGPHPLTQILALATDMGVDDLSTRHSWYAHGRLEDKEDGT